MKKFYYYLFLFFSISCSDNSIKEMELKSSLSQNEENDKVILAGVSSMDFGYEQLLITEYDYNRFYFLSLDFSQLKTFDKPTNSLFPNYPNFGKFENENHWIYSTELKKIFKYSDNVLSLEVKIESDTDLLNFDIRNNEILYSRVGFSDHPFVSYNVDTGKEVIFGEYFDDKPNKFLNHYLLNSYSFIVDSGYLFVLPYIGKILKYNKEFELVEEFNLLDEDNFSKSKEFFENFYISKSNSLLSIVSDCKIINNRLYLLIYERNPDLPVNPRKVLVLDFDKYIKIKNMFTLGEKESYYTKFCAIGINRFAFFEHQTSTIQYFDFPE